MELLGDLERAFASTIYPNRVPIAIAAAFLAAGLVILARRRRWDLAARRHPRATIAAVIVAIAVGGPLGWYLGSPLFLSTSIDEAAPAAVVQASTGPEPTAAAPGGDERSGMFAGTDEFHFGSGTVQLIETEPGSFTVRLEDFAVRNGPDLFVYLSPSADGYTDDSVELGRLKADTGNQNYEVPEGVDVAGVGSVLIWCKQFAVLFAIAPLEPAAKS